ncbi:hypothetical protein [Sagittula sp.]|uniref:hypothetical protein n=1 Tax=Sagittula sp. TaxID=2038081 RepID=UPI004059827C
MTGVANLDLERAGKAMVSGRDRTAARVHQPLPVMVAKASFVAFRNRCVARRFAVNMNYLVQPLGDAS